MGLSRAVAARGIPTLKPKRISPSAGSFNTEKGTGATRRLCERVLTGQALRRADLLWGGGTLWKDLHGLPRRLVVHVAPPRAAFSREKDMHFRTQRRSADCPWGYDQSDDGTQRDNAMAIRIGDLGK